MQLNPQGLACENRHQFDRAREGYFNLMPVHHKHSREPGDAKEQLEARRRFLQAGFFSPLQEQLKALIPPHTQTLLDIGCGEGYFTHAFASALPQASVYGVDIAKAGVRLAARAAMDKHRQVFAVASSYALPLADASMDVITRIYAPSKDAELWRVIKPEGLLVIVAPAENHLLGLRQRIYNQVRPHELPSVPAGFHWVASERITHRLVIDEPEIVRSLLAMTPFAWKLPKALSDELAQQGLEDQVDFGVYLYHRVAN